MSEIFIIYFLYRIISKKRNQLIMQNDRASNKLWEKCYKQRIFNETVLSR